MPKKVCVCVHVCLCVCVRALMRERKRESIYYNLLYFIHMKPQHTVQVPPKKFTILLMQAA